MAKRKTKAVTNSLIYAVVYSNGQWGGLWSTEKQAQKQVDWSIKHDFHLGRPIGVFKLLKRTYVTPSRDPKGEGEG